MAARVTRLGQNFLVDPNILGVIERLAALDHTDVVLEIGAGQGVLSERLAQRARFTHVIELDAGLERHLRELLAPNSNVAIYIADALEIDLGTLAPEPNKLVANLPYGVAASMILRSIAELTSVHQWVVMVQREVGERFAASPGSAAYGVPSVLAQLDCEVRVLRRVSRQVFRPVPNVDSVLLGLSRRAAQRSSTTVSTLVHDAFRHRRKALAGSLALAPGADPGVRERAQAALVALGLPADARAERLSPAQFVALAEHVYRAKGS